MPSLFLTRKLFSSAGSHSTQTLLFSLWPNPKTRAWVDVQIGLSRHSWGVILESAWSVFLAGVETGEPRPLGWWSSKRLGWVSAGFRLRFCCGFRSRWVWFDFGSWFDFIWFWDWVMIWWVQREGSTMMFEDLTPFTRLGFGLALTSRRERIRRLTVPLDRRKASVTAKRAETEIQVFHRRTK